jgi:beta-phosphoglucomutase-like phosphatase (HAD superfamily)
MPSAISRDQYDAVLLDLDGVITDTANMHSESLTHTEVAHHDRQTSQYATLPGGFEDPRY